MHSTSKIPLIRCRLCAPLVAFAAGISLAFALFPADLLFGLASYFDHVQGDNAQNWIGYAAFAQDEWRWPLFKTTLLSPPNGINILFTDPIPILALFGKIVFKATGFLPNYFGPWLLLAYGLQPMTAYFVLRAIGLARTSALVGALLFLVVPTFIFRYGHFPLLGHWLILIALLNYFKIVRYGGTAHVAFGLAFTLTFILINPYLLVMVAAIYAAALGDGVLHRTLSHRSAGAALVTLPIGVFGAASFFGFIDLSKPPLPGGGFGLYSMNLLSPVIPQLSSWPGRAAYILDATGGQYEGYNYLGSGILILVVLAGIAASTMIAAFVRAHWCLVLAALVLAIYALSSDIYVGNILIAHLPLERFRPLAIFSGIFRSSGRFFWPMAYLLVLITMYVLYNRLGQRRFNIIVLAAMAMQWGDIRPLLSSVAARAAPSPDVLDTRRWRTASKHHDEMLILPQFLCTSWSNRKYAYQLGKLAADLRIPTNSAIINRSDVHCAAEKVAFTENIRALATKPNPLVVIFKDEINANVVQPASNRAGMSCRNAAFAYVCSATPLDPEILTLDTQLDPPPTVKLGELLSAGKGGRGVGFLAGGWSAPDEQYVWGEGPIASLSMRMAEPVCGDVVLRMTVLPFSFGAHVIANAEIGVNGQASALYSVMGRGDAAVIIPIHQTGCSQSFDVNLKFTGLKSPKDLGMNNDPRLLSWALKSFTLNR